MSEQELKEWLYRPKAIVPSNAGDENPFVGIWFRDLLECKKAIERDCVAKACEWLKEYGGVYWMDDYDLPTDELVNDFRKAMEEQI